MNPLLPKNWSAFLVSILLLMILPLVPLFLEYMFRDEISIKSLSITTAVYAISIGAAQREAVVIWLGVLISMIYVSVFGFVVRGEVMGVVAYAPRWSIWAFVGIGLMSLAHGYHRYQAHVVGRLDFPSHEPLD